MKFAPPLPSRPTLTEVVHHVTLRHQVEVEVWPARAQLYFADERWTDPINTQLRFEARVLNSQRGVHWEVRDPDGNPGAGSIDATGLYRAPDKGTLASGTTEIVIATALEDPLRKAHVWVTLVGVGPLPQPKPRVEIWPRQATLYYWAAENQFIDDTNKTQVFRVEVHHSNSAVDWSIHPTGMGATEVGGPWLQYWAPTSGLRTSVIVRAQLHDDPSVFDAARIYLTNYIWPGVWPL